jgi:hypothetical protein
MGTRADFYVGKGKDAEWIGSIAWDGYRDGIPGYIRKAKTEKNFRKAVDVFLSKRDDATRPNQGWPWPWNDSGTTDCSYWFFDGQCWDVYPKIGGGKAAYTPCREEMPKDDLEQEQWAKDRENVEFPDMSHKKNTVFEGQRSGLIVVKASRG